MPERKGPIPRLRFPEFRNAGPWEVKRLGEVFYFSSGSTPPKNNVKLWSGSLPWISASSMYDARIDRSDYHISEDAVENGAAIAEQGAILLLVRGSMLFKRIPVGVAARRVAFNQDIKALTPKIHGTNIPFFLHYLTSLEWLLLSKVLPTGIGAGKLETSDLVELEIAVPSVSEQQKIADCLTSLDELIRAEEGAVAALRDHKRGLMQQLFPRAGETTPRLRFPEFRDAGPWEVKRLGEVCDVNPSSGERPPSFVYIDLESVEAGELIQKRTISRENAPSRAQRLLQKGDVIYQMVRPYQRNNLFFDIHDGESYVASTGYALLRAKQSSAFLYHLVHTVPFTDSVLEKCTGSNYPAISSFDLAGIRVAIPSHLEQQKIADCLTSLDDLIRAREARLDVLRAHKTGLMQQLFPQEVR